LHKQNKKKIMGCFSFICKNSNKAIASSSFDGDACRLFLLKDGRVIEEMYGHYDSYGCVFSGTKNSDDTSLTYESSFDWKMKWSDVCDLMFSYDESNGIAAVLDKYWDGVIPTTRSESDPNQGWGERNDSNTIVDKPYHKVY
jgi:hypothetical protein